MHLRTSPFTTVKEKKPREMCGKLIVPAEADIISAEPAIVMLAKKGGYLLSEFPLEIKKDYAVHPSSEKDFLQSQKNGKANEIKIITTFNKSQNILARPLDDSKKVYAVATFNRTPHKINGQPESGNEIDIIHQGWMFAEDLERSVESFKPFSNGIFQSVDNQSLSIQPYPHVVNQTWIADCFLLSTVISILYSKHGADFFTHMMRQMDDGTTIVRLYHPITLQPHFIRVKNSYHTVNGQSTIAHTQLWIHLLEKAYAIFAFNSQEEKEFPSFLSVYGKGGDASVAFKILTGKDAKKIILQEAANNYPLHPLSILAVINIAESKPSEIDSMLAEHPELYAMFGDMDTILLWGTFLLTLRNNNHPEYFKLLHLNSSYSDIKNIDDSLSKLSIIEVEGKIIFPERIGKIIKISSMPRVDENKRIFYPSAENAYQGEYTQYHYAVFDQLKTLSEKNHILTAATHPHFAEKTPGLVPKHEYAVVSVYECSSQGHTLLKVRLHNPWGRMGCRYSGIGKLEEEKEYSLFDLNIEDFTKYFSSYSVCEAPIKAPLYLKKLILKPQYMTLALLYNRIHARFNEIVGGEYKEKELSILHKQLLEELSDLSFAEIEGHVDQVDDSKRLQADFFKLKQLCEQAKQSDMKTEEAKELISTFLKELKCMTDTLPPPHDIANSYNNLVNKSQDYINFLFQQIENDVKNNYPALYLQYSLDRLIFNEDEQKLKIVKGFNIEDFISEQKEMIAKTTKENSLFQLNIKKYNVMRKANNVFKNNDTILVKVEAYKKIITTNKTLLSKDPWYFSLMKTVAVCVLSLASAGLGSVVAYRFFFGKNSTESKKFLTSIKPALSLSRRIE